MSECEAYYKILPNLHLKYSSLDSIFIPTDKKELRSRFLRKLAEDDEHLKYGGKVTGGREGLFVEKPDIVDKYCRRIIPDTDLELQELSLLQFGKMYQPIQKKMEFDQDENDKNEGSKNHIKSSSKQEYHWTNEEDRITNNYITINPEYDYTPLPNFIKLKDCQPGEVPIWKKRSFLRAARFHKKKEDINPYRYFLSELM